MIRTRSGLTVQPLRRPAKSKEVKPKVTHYESEEGDETDEVDEGDEEEELNEQHVEPTPLVRPTFIRASNGPELLARKPSRATQTSPSPQRTGTGVDLRRRSPAPAKLGSACSKTLPTKGGLLPSIDEAPEARARLMAGPEPPSSSVGTKRWMLIVLVMVVAAVAIAAVYGTHITDALFQTTCSWQPDIEEALARECDHGLLSTQPPLTRKQLFELPLHAEKAAPKRPICIVSASLDPNGQAGRHLAMGLAPKLFPSSSRLFEVASSSYSDWAPDEMDRDLTRRIDRHFLHCGKGMLLIKDFDTLPDPHRLLWRLCDDDHPLFPEAVILLATSPQLLEKSGIARADAQLASDSGYRALGQQLRVALADKWRSNYKERAFDPLWSRIANLVVFFR